MVNYLHYPVLIMKLGESICLFLNKFFPKPPVAGRESARSYAESQYDRAYSSWVLYESHVDLKDKHCLDAGCSLGGKTIYYAEKGCKSIVGVDIDDKYVEHARQFAEEKGILNAQFKVSEINDLPFESDTFDLIFLNDVVEHIRRPVLIEALQECKRVVKPNGKICLEFPPWTSWDASHLYDYIYIPWCQLFFSDDTLMSVLGRMDLNPRFGRLSAFEHFQELNRITIAEFWDIVGNLNLKVDKSDRRMIMKKRFLKYIPFINKYLTTRVVAILSK